MYGPGYTWEALKKKLLDNYPEGSPAERGTPSRIRQIVQEAQSQEMQLSLDGKICSSGIRDWLRPRHFN